MSSQNGGSPKKEPISVVVWKWQVANRPADFHPEYVNILAAMIRRHLPEKHRFICVTSEPAGLDSSVEVVPPPVTFDWVPAPAGVRFPSSYRRLWNFSPEAREVLGPRILALDIDVIITGDLTPLVRAQEDFVSWWDPRFVWKKIPGGIYLLRTGTLPMVWSEFDPDRSPAIAAKAGCKGSDQGWMSYMLYPAPKAWTVEDGVYSIKWISQRKPLSPDVRVISTPGFDKPWTPALQHRFPWILKHWRK